MRRRVGPFRSEARPRGEFRFLATRPKRVVVQGVQRKIKADGVDILADYINLLEGQTSGWRALVVLRLHQRRKTVWRSKSNRNREILP